MLQVYVTNSQIYIYVGWGITANSRCLSQVCLKGSRRTDLRFRGPGLYTLQGKAAGPAADPKRN